MDNNNDDEVGFTELDDSDFNYDELDSNIRKSIRLLRGHGFDTTDSGDGKAKFELGQEHGDIMPCGLQYPNIAIIVDPFKLTSETIRLAEIISEIGIQLQPMGWHHAHTEDLLSFEDDPPGWDIENAVEIEGSFDPIDGSAVIIVLYLDDTKLELAGYGKTGNN